MSEQDPPGRLPDLHHGERVRITEGTFEGYKAKYLGRNPETGNAQLLIDIFGRDAPFELPYSFLERS